MSFAISFLALMNLSMKQLNRDSFIDNARGLTVISVIFIHTVFYSGYSYVLEWVRSLSLYIDVPLFFS